ncbi:dol-P-Man:Man(7)GlcNAc(2)-PP-Dol alpha-1,6-mannosyltransferase, partial [Dendroctonus ponderosae]
MSQIITIIATAHLVYCPFTKVEESFNLQAIHDILYHKWNISQYDHLEFPGVVPRTFLGPIFISFFAAPFVFILRLLNLNKFWAQYIVRTILALTVILSLKKLSNTLEKQFGSRWLQWFIAITVTQSHFMFYMSRPLPNIMALPLVLLALDGWLRNDTRSFIWFSGGAIIIFRSELALYLGILLIYDLYCQRISMKGLLQVAVPAGGSCLLLTIIVDSIFWNRALWPEGEVLWYNTILNRSSNWGTSPFLWYFYSALPRGLAASVLLVPIGCVLDQRVRKLVGLSLLFVFFYSFLPHKELRFIIYVFPFMNVAAATTCHRMWENRNKSPIYHLLSLGAAGHLAANVVFTVFLLSISGTNYPGGSAISHLHRLAKNEPQVHVHIANLAAQTGVSRFAQVNDSWIYDKTENLKPTDMEIFKFTHLIEEGKSKYAANMKLLMYTHDVIDTIEAFHQISFNYLTIPPVKIKTRPALFILKRRQEYRDILAMRGIGLEDAELDQAAVPEEYEYSEETGVSAEKSDAEPVIEDSKVTKKKLQDSAEESLKDDSETKRAKALNKVAKTTKLKQIEATQEVATAKPMQEKRKSKRAVEVLSKEPAQ